LIGVECCWYEGAKEDKAEYAVILCSDFAEYVLVRHSPLLFLLWTLDTMHEYYIEISIFNATRMIHTPLL